MAHFAKLNENDEVIEIIVVSNQEIQIDGIDDEQLGIDFCQLLFGGNWKQTSYNGNMRKQFAGVGYSYNSDLDMFISPKCHNQAILNELGNWDCDSEEHNG